MRIALQQIRANVFAPRLRCDGCDEPITDARLASVEYRKDTKGEFYVVHKGECSYRFWNRMGGRGRTVWLGLDEFLALLLSAVSLDEARIKEARATTKRMNEIMASLYEQTHR